MQLSRTECKKTGVAVETWKRRRYNEEALNIMCMRRESVARRRPPSRNYMRLTMKSVSAKSLACERPKPSSSSDVSFERRRREAASKTATNRASERASEQFLRESIECNCTESVLGQSGGAERTNERRHRLVKFDLKPVVCRQVPCDFKRTEFQQQKKLGTEVGTEWGCSIWVLNFGKA
jgi:hypothetical protein